MVLLSSCKKNKTYEVKGIVYKDCNRNSAAGMQILLRNYRGFLTTRKTVPSLLTKVKSDGSFIIKYKHAGGSPLEISVLPDEMLPLNQNIDLGKIIGGGEAVIKVSIKASNYLTASDTLYYHYGGDYKIDEETGKLTGPFNDTTFAEVKKLFGGIRLSDVDSIKFKMGSFSYSLNKPPLNAHYDNEISLEDASPCSKNNELVIELN